MFDEFMNNLKVFQAQVEGSVTDAFLEILLRSMDTAFNLDSRYRILRGYQRNIEGFRANYVFNTKDGRVAASASFRDGDMIVFNQGLGQWDVKVTFEDSKALRDFLFSENRDIVDSLLGNKVSLDGNLNYIYKFGFMARDLAHRVGL